MKSVKWEARELRKVNEILRADCQRRQEAIGGGLRTVTGPGRTGLRMAELSDHP